MRPHENLYATYFFALADPLERVLRELSPEYLATAWTRVASALGDAGETVEGWRFGWVNPGYGAVPGRDTSRPYGPLDYVGWVSRDAYDVPGSAKDKLYERLGGELRRGFPALIWGATSSRAYWFELPGNDRGDDAAGVEALVDFATDEPSDWDPQVIRERGVEANEPYYRCMRAHWEGDASEMATALRDADAVYSPAGARIVRAVIACWPAVGGGTRSWS